MGQNLAVFLEGDLVGIDPSAEKDPRLAVYSVTPVKLLSISKARMRTTTVSSATINHDRGAGGPARASSPAP